jgi:hypothetical protein
LEISDEDLKSINKWKRGQHYLDELAAKAKRGTSKKRLTFKPFFLSLNMEPEMKGAGAMKT